MVDMVTICIGSGTRKGITKDDYPNGEDMVMYVVGE